MQLRVLAFVLAGGKGTRLYPLTKERAKPAVPFGGRYRIVDFVLSNLINSGIYSIYVLIQFKSQSLLQHLRDGWESNSLLKSHFIIPVPAQMRSAGETWYRGTADAIYQNINLIEQADPHVVVIFGADHIYRMNIREYDRVPPTEASGGQCRRDSGGKGIVHRVRRYRNDRQTAQSSAFTRSVRMRPPCPEIPSASTRPWGTTSSARRHCCGSCTRTRQTRNSTHDFGRDILPNLIGRSPMYAYDFQTNVIEGDPPGHPVYWRDVGTIDAYYDASMDLRQVSPVLNLYNRQWPLRTAGYSDAPAKFTFDEEGTARTGDRFDRRRRQYLVGRHCEAVGAGTRRSRAHRRAGRGFA